LLRPEVAGQDPRIRRIAAIIQRDGHVALALAAFVAALGLLADSPAMERRDLG